MWCIPELTDTFIERMMDILEIYERPYNPQEPVICLDEKSMQLLAHVREPISVTPGIPERYDSEYKRKGTASIFVMVEPKAGTRHLIMKERKRYKEYAVCMDFLSTFYNEVDKIIVIQDNFRTHNKKSLIKAFGKKKADKIMEKVEFHYTPKHGSWLNMAEIEIGVMDTECLRKRRIPDMHTLTHELTAWKIRRNDKKAVINWRFTRKKAEEKFKLIKNKM
ncbi:MAG: IS630 family transposase [Theionarchaea archaeon]|nr:IS630 family transposase [Theionarchaea archaeon]